MDKKSKVLIWIFVVLTAISIGYTYYKTVVLQDFEIIYSSEDEEGATEVDIEEDIQIPEEFNI